MSMPQNLEREATGDAIEQPRDRFGDHPDRADRDHPQPLAGLGQLMALVDQINSESTGNASTGNTADNDVANEGV